MLIFTTNHLMKTNHVFRFFIICTCLWLQSCSRQSVAPTKSGREDNLALGNPSKATTDVNNQNNYLSIKTQYVLSYNTSRGTANWVSWHLGKDWKGNAQRQENFSQDNSLPVNWYRVNPGDYTNTGFDRGHLCPSDDRDGSIEDNTATFLMSNIIPQAPDNNRVTWKNLEEYCRDLVDRGNELYIIAGAYGKGGSGSNGGTTHTIADGRVMVPSRIWKIIVVLPEGGNDLARITSSIRIISVDMPNKQTVDKLAWHDYRVSVDAIEAATGYDFLSNVSYGLQLTLEAKADNELVNP